MQLVKVSQPFIESENSLQCSQDRATEPEECIPQNSHTVSLSHFNIILPSTLQYSEQSLFFRLSHKNVISISSHARYMLHPSHHSSLDTLTTFGKAHNL